MEDDLDDIGGAVLEWLNTFSSVESKNLGQLQDGSVLMSALHEMCPTNFDLSSIPVLESTADWTDKATNLRKILELLESYYRDVLQKKVDVTKVNVNLIARANDEEELVGLIELVLGVAVLGEAKARLVPVIFSLSSDSQVETKSDAQCYAFHHFLTKCLARSQ
jgi:hypothetical protein